MSYDRHWRSTHGISRRYKHAVILQENRIEKDTRSRGDFFCMPKFKYLFFDFVTSSWSL